MKMQHSLSLLGIKQWGRVITYKTGTTFYVPITMKNELFRAQSLANGSAKDLTSIEPLNGDYIIYGFGSAGAWVAWLLIGTV